MNDSNTQLPTGPEATHESRPKRMGAVVIFLLTLAYLCLELPFSVDLLNGVGHVSTPTQLQHLEIAGRLISGLALVLLVWQFVVAPLARLWSHRRVWTVVICLAVTPAIVFVVYRTEGALVSSQPSRLGASALQMAYTTVLFAQGVQSGQVEIKGLPFTSSTRKQPDAMAFMALLPFMSSHIHDIRARLMPAAKRIVIQRLVAQTGGPETFYDQTYLAAIAPVRTMFNHYRDGLRSYNRQYQQYEHGLDRYRKAMSSASSRAESVYWSYRKRLARDIHSQGPAPSWECPIIRRKVERAYHIHLPDDWNCWAKEPFVRAIIAHERYSASRHLERARHELVTHRPHHVFTTFDAFVRQPAVQQRLREGWRRHGIPVPEHISLTNQTVSSWSKLVYHPFLESRATAMVRHFNGQAKDFAPGGPYYAWGKASHELLMIPAIALLFSLLGALIHIVKIIVEMSIIIRPQKALHWRDVMAFRWRHAVRDKPAFVLRYVSLALGILLVSFPIVRSTPVTRSSVFQGISRAMRSGKDGNNAHTGSMAAIFSRWAIQTEAAIYPFNARLRNTVDQVFDFEHSGLVRTIACHSAPLQSPLGVGEQPRSCHRLASPRK